MEFTENLQSYLQDEHPELSILKLDHKTLVLRDPTINIKLAVPWAKLLDKYIKEWLHTGMDEHRVYFGHVLAHYDYHEGNRNTVVLPNLGFYKDRFAEFFICYGAFQDDFHLWSFQIGDVQVNIGYPSQLFRFIFGHIAHDDYFSGWEDMFTIQLRNVTKDTFSQYLDQAKYVMMRNCPSPYLHDVPSIEPFVGEDDGLVECPDPVKGLTSFLAANYPEAISFFTAGKSSEPSEFAFMYYYKVLEHFFVINRKAEIEKIINSYMPNLDKVVAELTGLYRTDELSSLKYLLAGLTGSEELANSAYQRELVPVSTVDQLSEHLYAFRNSVAHGKRDPGFPLRIPGLIQDETLHGWTSLARELAILCIEKFCYAG